MNLHNKEKDFLQTRFPCDKCGELVRKNLDGTYATHLCHNEEKEWECCEKCFYPGDLHENSYGVRDPNTVDCTNDDCTCHSPLPHNEEKQKYVKIDPEGRTGYKPEDSPLPPVEEWNDPAKLFKSILIMDGYDIDHQESGVKLKELLTTQQAKWKADIITALEARKWDLQNHSHLPPQAHHEADIRNTAIEEAQELIRHNGE